MSPAAGLGARGPGRGPSPTELADAARTLRQLELTVTRRLDGLLHGDHRGLVHGAGSEAGDSRRYEPGDDVRRIDWNLTARTGEPHVRETVADRELETWLVVDGTASADFGTARREKRDLTQAVVAAFGFLAARAGNRVGAVVFDGHRLEIVPPATGRDPLLGLLARLGRRGRVPISDPATRTGQPGGPTLADALVRTRLLARRRGLVVVVSDLLDRSDWATPMRVLGTRHDVVVARVSDPRERELPAAGLVTYVDPETGRRHEVQTSDRRLRQRYAAAAAERDAAIATAVRGTGAGRLEVGTDRDWLLDVVGYVVARRRRR